ncbi:MAG: SUMF1/EgtB/PvdO family nonheme iron enzyme, partial [Gammaproteobacteria bacterium]|nr:SUMF1/EgtB/PvdO family nonheme iron enzyme [Gammaproteobacteria bacterium]
YIEGESLKQKIASGAIQREDAINIALQIVDALREAHEKGIVHRDIKPANIMLTPKGQVVLMDFGLAKSPAQDQLTKTGTTIGTAAYMSPEQACGEHVDHRTDIWSVGVVLYQMLAGEAPFKGEHEHAIVYSVLNLDPEPPTKISHDIPRELEHVVLQCLQKDPSSRFESMRELHSVLSAFTAQQIPVTPPQQGRQNIIRLLKRPVVFIPVFILAMILAIVSFQYSQRAEKIRWAREEALPEIGQLAQNQKYLSAYRLALQAKPIIPADTVLSALWTDITAKFSIHTIPEDADVYMKPYDNPEDKWELLGRTPIDSVDVPKEYFRWKIEKDGYEPIEAAGSWTKGRVHYVLDQAGTIPDEMVKVPGGNASIWNIISYETFTLEDFYIDKFEVTNQQFKTFVDDGGYEHRELWKHEFIDDDRTLSWDESMDLFHDATGRSGPATWELGTYLDGQEDVPVSGISWYEAAAYAEFVGKSLPTVTHWMYAASIREGAHIIPLSNFGDVGLTAVGRQQGHSEFGIYDVAGNAREWCYNASEGNRSILGGSWSDPSYSFNFLFSRRAFDRSAENGFRCARYFSGDKTLTS